MEDLQLSCENLHGINKIEIGLKYTVAKKMQYYKNIPSTHSLHVRMKFVGKLCITITESMKEYIRRM